MKMRHTLIIGGTRGTGRALVKAFAAKNHIVSVLGRRPPSETDAKAANVHYWAVDLLNRKRLAKALAEIVRKNGQLNSLVFCQRYRGQADVWMGNLQTNLTATKHVVESVTDSFDDAGDKSIVMIGSVAGQFIAGEQPIGYHVAKAGLIQMVRYFAVTLGPKNIRVNAVSPSAIVKEESKDFYLNNAELTERYRRICPLGRMGTAEEVADAVQFLCSAKASFITGQNIVVDGGLSLAAQESLARKLSDLNPPLQSAHTPKKRK